MSSDMEAESKGGVALALQPSAPFLLDDESRLRVLHPDLYTSSRQVEDSCCTFRSKLQKFQNLVRTLLAHVDEQHKRIETSKLEAIGTRNMMSAELESRSEVLRDQRSLIADKQEQLQRLQVELKSLLVVKQEQEVLIAHLSESSPRTLELFFLI